MSEPAAPPPTPIESWEVLDLLASLVQKSLVLYEEDEHGQGRYRLLETVRQYARDRLLEASEADAVREQHRDWFVALAEKAEPELEGAEQAEWLDRLEQEHDNLRAALAWSRAPGQKEGGLRLGGALRGFWDGRGHWTEGREHLAGLLALLETAAPTAARAKALYAAWRLAQNQGDHEAAGAHLEERLAIVQGLGNQRDVVESLGWLGRSEESLAISRELGDRQGIADSLGGLAGAAAARWDYEAAAAHFEECLEINHQLGNKKGIALCLFNLGDAARAQGSYSEARSRYEESLAINRELGDKYSIGYCLRHGIGQLARELGEYEAARKHFEESLAISKELGNKEGIAWSLNRLAWAAHDQGQYGAARTLLEEGLAIHRELGDKRAIAYSLGWLERATHALGEYGAARALSEECLAIYRSLGPNPDNAEKLSSLAMVAHAQEDDEAARALFKASLAIFREVRFEPGIAMDLDGLALVAAAQAQPERAARLFGAADGLRQGKRAPLAPADRADHERRVAAVRTALGERAFAAAWAEGRAMSLQDAIQYALEGTEPS